MIFLLRLGCALILRSEQPVPSLDEYLGFPVDADAKNLSALGPLLPAPDVAGRIETHANGTTMTRVGCPTGVVANLAQLKQQALHAPRVYAATKVAPKPTYIFVIVPPGYGSTAVLSLLATSPHVGTLCKSAVGLNCEGWYVLQQHGLLATEDRWRRDRPLDWVQAIATFRSYLPVGKPLMVEKSPNNIVKTQQIAQQLTIAGHNVRFVVMSRSPCFVEAPGLDHGGSLYTWAWEFFAQEMLDTLQRGPSGPGTVEAIHIQYENLLKDPYSVANRLLQFLPELESLDPTTNPLASMGGHMLDGDRAKSVVSYMLKYKRVQADHASVDGKYRQLMRKLGYATPARSPKWQGEARAKPPPPPPGMPSPVHR